ncbi:MAG: 30S ribosome-binding factor RbfA [Phycisphaerae bacterium]|nr:30S ribosome-binding factor RbfA [Phycisphaerae bacterium]
MATRRQEKVSRVIKEAVSDAIANHLGDPRITGFVSVTYVELAPDLRNAEVYLSIFGCDEKDQKLTFTAIEHARSKIQSLLRQSMTSKFCPVLHFHIDEKFKKTIETLNIIEKAAKEIVDENEPQDDFQ